MMAEQTARLQELRRQLSPGFGSRADSGPAAELQVVQEELSLALRRDKENQELSRSQAVQLDSLSRTLHVKQEMIRVSESWSWSCGTRFFVTFTLLPRKQRRFLRLT